jgi:hypothetical protein
VIAPLALVSVIAVEVLPVALDMLRAPVACRLAVTELLPDMFKVDIAIGVERLMLEFLFPNTWNVQFEQGSAKLDGAKLVPTLLASPKNPTVVGLFKLTVPLTDPSVP